MELKNFHEYLKKRLTPGDVKALEERVKKEMDAIIAVATLNNSKDLSIAYKVTRRAPGLWTASRLKKGSKIFEVSEIIRKAGKPLHIKEIMKALGDSRPYNGLAGTLNHYCDNQKAFTKPAPNIYGLIEPD